jgi:hypothetical protein
LPRQIRDALIAQASLVRYEFDAAGHIRLIDPDDQDELALAAPPITSMRCSCTGPSRVMRFGARPRRCTRSGLGLGRRLSDPWPSLRHIRSRNPSQSPVRCGRFDRFARVCFRHGRQLGRAIAGDIRTSTRTEREHSGCRSHLQRAKPAHSPSSCHMGPRSDCRLASYGYSRPALKARGDVGSRSSGRLPTRRMNRATGPITRA